MTFKKIIGFGDSWMYGDELLDPELLAFDPTAHTCWVQNNEYREQHCFLGLLGQHYGVPTENFGIPGGSLQSTVWTYLRWIQQENSPQDCLILVGLTNSNRYSFYNPRHIHYSDEPSWNKFVHSKWVEFASDAIDIDFADMVKKFMTVSDCPELAELNYQQTLWFFDGQAARSNLKLLQFDISPPPIALDVESKIFHGLNLCSRIALKWFFPGNHPNEKGHEIIRDMLINEIDRVILSE